MQKYYNCIELLNHEYTFLSTKWYCEGHPYCEHVSFEVTCRSWRLHNYTQNATQLHTECYTQNAAQLHTERYTRNAAQLHTWCYTRNATHLMLHTWCCTQDAINMPLHTEVCTGYTPTHLTRHTSGYKHDATHLTLHTCTLHTLCYTRNAKPHSTQLMLHTELYTATHRALHKCELWTAPFCFSQTPP